MSLKKYQCRIILYGRNFIPSNAEATFLQKNRNAKIFEKHLNPCMLVFSGKFSLSTLIFQLFFLLHFVLAKLATTSIRKQAVSLKKYCNRVTSLRKYQYHIISYRKHFKDGNPYGPDANLPGSPDSVV